MIRRIFGITLLVVGLIGVGLSFAGVRLLYNTIDEVTAGLDEALRLTTESLDTVVETLVLAQSTVQDMNTAVNTAQTTAANLATTIDDTQPLLDELGRVATQDIPESVEAVQASLPALEQAAGTIDSTLRTLSRFEIDQSILGFRLQYDLGIDYNPDLPFDVAVIEIGTSLEDIPESLRSLEEQLTLTSENLDTISQNVNQLGEDIGVINERIAETDPLLQEYMRIFAELNDNIRLVRQQLEERAAAVKQAVTIAFVWIGLMQLPALYLGLELVTGERDPDRYVSREEFEAVLAKVRDGETAVTPEADEGEPENEDEQVDDVDESSANHS